MGQFNDITGERYGKLVALRPTDKRTKGGGVVWRFLCDCGKEKDLPANSVRMNLVKSCGCIAKPHGKSNTRLFTVWIDMKQRCFNSNHPQFRYWGGKGIKVCSEWLEFKAFEEWSIANGYSETLTIDRKDGNGNYEPSNCRWATYKEQSLNLSSNHLIDINGTIKPLSAWVEELNIVSAATVYRRVREFGWDFKKALTTPHLRNREYRRAV